MKSVQTYVDGVSQLLAKGKRVLVQLSVSWKDSGTKERRRKTYALQNEEDLA